MEFKLPKLDNTREDNFDRDHNRQLAKTILQDWLDGSDESFISPISTKAATDEYLSPPSTKKTNKKKMWIKSTRIESPNEIKLFTTVEKMS